MRIKDQRIHLSATDLANHLGCQHLTRLNRAVAEDRREVSDWHHPMLEILAARGEHHEQVFLRGLKDSGLNVVEIGDAGIDRTIRAMRAGNDVIYQAPLEDQHWHGRADFLRKVDLPSDLGDWSYEVIDAKLATETRGGTILQACIYSEIVGRIQGHCPEYMYVVTPRHDSELERYRLDDFSAYHRLVKSKLENATKLTASGVRDATYPELVPQCEICRWWPECDRRRRCDDHLCYVAGINKGQIVELIDRGIDTLQKLADLEEVPRPNRGGLEPLVRIRDQARIQVRGRDAGVPKYELLEPFGSDHGLALLPAPSPGDIFLDLEGDHFAKDGGREYLIGYVTSDSVGSTKYTAIWATDFHQECTAFEHVVDFAIATWQQDPGMHIYHFAPYEPTALKRLMSRYASREIELDQLLRGERFVDLHTILKRSLRASVERYSLKDLEPFHQFKRTEDLRRATACRRAIEWALEFGQFDGALAEHVAHVERYNEEDCASAKALRDWVEKLRQEVIDNGHILPRPELKTGDASEKVEEHDQQIRELRTRLLDGVPEEPSERTPEQQAQWLMAHLLEWHHREDKPVWWEYFRLRDLMDEDLIDEKAALVGLTFESRAGGTAKCPIHRYRFPDQDHDIRPDDELYTSGEVKVGTVQALDLTNNLVDIRKTAAASHVHAKSVFAHRHVRAGVVADALTELGNWIATHGIDKPGPYRAARDLLLGKTPRFTSSSTNLTTQDNEDPLDTACRLAKEIDHSVLPIQGPPGTGKTYTGAQMIISLLQSGKKVGATAVSHKVIRNLLDWCVKIAREKGVDLSCIQKVKETTPDYEGPIDETKTNEAVDAFLASHASGLAAGTAWLWARPQLRESVDVLFIDEAGQMSLANVLAVTTAAKSIVLLGDPQQLEQPQQGSHPEGTDASALEHILGNNQTMPVHRGLFLDTTWRLHPKDLHVHFRGFL